MTKNELVKVAKELNKVIGCEPQITLTGKKATTEYLESKIAEAMELYDPEEDEFSAEVEELLVEMGYDVGEPVDKEQEEVEDQEPEVVEEQEEVQEPEQEEEEVNEEVEKKPEKKKKKKSAPTKKPEKKKGKREKNKFNHFVDSISGKIDNALLSSKKALTKKELAEAGGCSISRVTAHINHLIEKKDVNLKENKNGGWSIVK